MTSNEVHTAINEGLAKACSCHTFEVTRTDLPSNVLKLPASVISKTDCFMWVWTGYDDNVAPSELILPFDHFYRSRPDVNWKRYVLYWDGHIVIYKAHRDHAEFWGELCDPELVEKVRRFVGEMVETTRRFHNKAKDGRI